MSNSPIFHTGGVPGFIPNDNDMGCCTNMFNVRLDENGHIDGWGREDQFGIFPGIFGSEYITRKQCFDAKQNVLNIINKQRARFLNLSNTRIYFESLVDPLSDAEPLFPIFKFYHNTECEKLVSNCCTGEDGPTPCITEPYLECFDGPQQVGRLNECWRDCDVYGIFCDKDMPTCRTIEKFTFNYDIGRKFDNFMIDNDTIKLIPSRDLNLSSDTNIYFNQDNATDICKSSYVWIHTNYNDAFKNIFPKFGSSLDPNKNYCFRVSSLCFDVSEYQTFLTEEDCLSANDTTTGTCYIMSNHGCKFENCINNISYNDCADETNLFESDNNLPQNSVKFIFNQTETNCDPKTIKTIGKPCGQCKECDKNKNCIDVIPDDQCFECYDYIQNAPVEGQYFPFTTVDSDNLLWIFKSKCPDGSNYNSDTGECDPVEIDPNSCFSLFQKLRMSICPEFYAVYDCNPTSEKCCDGVCVPIDSFCTEVTPTPTVPTETTPTPTVQTETTPTPTPIPTTECQTCNGQGGTPCWNGYNLIRMNWSSDAECNGNPLIGGPLDLYFMYTNSPAGYWLYSTSTAIAEIRCSGGEWTFSYTNSAAGLWTVEGVLGNVSEMADPCNIVGLSGVATITWNLLYGCSGQSTANISIEPYVCPE